MGKQLLLPTLTEVPSYLTIAAHHDNTPVTTHTPVTHTSYNTHTHTVQCSTVSNSKHYQERMIVRGGGNTLHTQSCALGTTRPILVSNTTIVREYANTCTYYVNVILLKEA